MAIVFPKPLHKLVNIGTGLMTREWYDYFKRADTFARTATTYAQTILAATTAEAARVALGITAEGVWTPEYAVSGTTGQHTYVTRVGRYAKTGRTVTLQGAIAVSSGVSSTGPLTIVGFSSVAGTPSSAASGFAYAGDIVRVSSGVDTFTTYPSVFIRSTAPTVIEMRTVGAADPFPATALASTPFTWAFTINYQTSA